MRSNQGDCLKSVDNGEDMMPQDYDYINPLSFTDQCKFAFGGDYTKYNGRYQGKNDTVTLIYNILIILYSI